MQRTAAFSPGAKRRRPLFACHTGHVCAAISREVIPFPPRSTAAICSHSPYGLRAHGKYWRRYVPPRGGSLYSLSLQTRRPRPLFWFYRRATTAPTASKGDAYPRPAPGPCALPLYTVFLDAHRPYRSPLRGDILSATTARPIWFFRIRRRCRFGVFPLRSGGFFFAAPAVVADLVPFTDVSPTAWRR